MYVTNVLLPSEQGEEHMTKQELLQLLRLLSAVESAMSVNKATIPSYLFEQIDEAVFVLEREILK